MRLARQGNKRPVRVTVMMAGRGDPQINEGIPTTDWDLLYLTFTRSDFDRFDGREPAGLETETFCIERKRLTHGPVGSLPKRTTYVKCTVDAK